jgi:hypothetical protein
MNEDQREGKRKKDFERKRLQLQRMNGDGREEHRSQNIDQVREHQWRQWRGVNKVMTKTKCSSLTSTNHKNHQPIVLDDDELQTKPNVPVISYEDKFLAHENFRERIAKLGHMKMCHVCEESYLNIQVVTANTGSMCTRCKREGTSHRYSYQNYMNPELQPLVLLNMP